MGDKATLAKARRELEDLYLGVPDDSVNLSFQHLADVSQQQHANGKKPSPIMEPISEGTPKIEGPISHTLTKLPSLDFSKAFEQLSHNYHHHVAAYDAVDSHASRGDRYPLGEEDHHHVYAGAYTPKRGYDDVSIMRGASMSPHQERSGRRRPGIPHSNICTICSVHIYMFRHRCLVCGRVYCRKCVGIGMGEMSEGRKCNECLGRRFSERYIQEAGKIGCCMTYPSLVKQQELKWAEKGARKSGERGMGQNVMLSLPRSPMTRGPRTPGPRTPTRVHANNNPPSFVMNSPMSSYSHYSPTNHHLPF